jgi:hypothetical protein
MLRSSADLIPYCCEPLKRLALRVPARQMDHAAAIAKLGGPGVLDLPYRLDVTATEVPDELPVGFETLVNFTASLARLDEHVAAAYHRVANMCDADDIRSLQGDPWYAFREFALQVGSYPLDELPLAVAHARLLLHRIREFKRVQPRVEGFYFRLMCELTEGFRVVLSSFKASDMQAMFEHPDSPSVWADGGMSPEMICAWWRALDDTSSLLGRLQATEDCTNSSATELADRLVQRLCSVF